MVQKQKETILSLERDRHDNKNFTVNYLLPYQDFFDSNDDFTEFHCERLAGKEEYVSLIKQMFIADENAKVFADVYGFEEEKNDIWIYADTLIVFSSLPLFRIKQIFNKPKDIFPSEIGELTDLDEKTIIVDKDGNQSPAYDLCIGNYRVYYCWWD